MLDVDWFNQQYHDLRYGRLKERSKDDEKAKMLWILLVCVAEQQIGIPDSAVSKEMPERIRRRVLEHLENTNYNLYCRATQSRDPFVLVDLLRPQPRPPRKPSRFSQATKDNILEGVVALAILGIGYIVFCTSLSSILVPILVLIIAATAMWRWRPMLPIKMDVPPPGCLSVGVSYGCSGCGARLRKYRTEGWEEDYLKCSRSGCGVKLCQECAILFTLLRQLRPLCPRCSGHLEILKQGTTD